MPKFFRIAARVLAAAALSGVVCVWPTAAQTLPTEAASLTPEVNTTPAPAAKSWWDGDAWGDPDRGFNWYPPDEPKPKKKPAPKSAAKPAKPIYSLEALRATRSMEEFREIIKGMRDVAVMDPTPTNVLTYLRAQKFMLDKSNYFSDQSRRLVWTNPDIDHNGVSSVAANALANEKSREWRRQRETVSELSQQFGLLYFFRGDCGYCHDMAPIMRQIERDNGMEVVGVSLDGGKLKEFPNALMDRGLSETVSGGMGITVTPATYLVSKDKKTFQLIGTGALGYEEVIGRMRVLMKTQVGRNHERF